MLYATMILRESGGSRLSCSHGLTSHAADVGSKSRDPVVMLRYHHNKLPRCTCRLAGSPAPTTRPAAVERKAARPAAPRPAVDERKADTDAYAAAVAELIGTKELSYSEVPREAWAAIDAVRQHAETVLGTGKLRFHLYTPQPGKALPGFVSPTRPHDIWLALAGSPTSLLEVGLHEAYHVKQILDRDRRSKAEQENSAHSYALHWLPILNLKAYSW